MSLFPLPTSDAKDLYRLRDGLYAVDLLGAAIVEFDFFTHLCARPFTLSEICADLDLKERPVDVLLTLSAAMELVQRDAVTGQYSVTDKAKEFLVRGSPLYMGAYFAALRERPVCRDFVRVLRSGKPAHWGSFQEEQDWANAMEDEAFAKTFTAAMDCRGMILAPAMAANVDASGCRRLLDVAGGSGVYACAMVAHHTNLQAAVLEKPPVDGVARRAIADRGAADAVAVLAGDMFAEDWPEGFDAHLISNVLHDWDVAEVKRLLTRSWRSLPPGGLLILHDAHIDEHKSGPLAVAMYSTLLMHSSEGKCYSLGEMRAWLSEIGFVDFKFSDTTMDRSVITVRKP